ncbi:MAG: hypothetical protein KGI38_03135 [Thaumarchaeota archaeon]|nr:hypothetical protein [Nitrososphaerota archaeon]
MKQTNSRRVRGKRISASQDGVAEDWGKTRPFWCLNCGRGYRSVERILAHYSEAGHGNETMSIGSRGLSKKQQLEAFRLRNK